MQSPGPWWWLGGLVVGTLLLLLGTVGLPPSRTYSAHGVEMPALATHVARAKTPDKAPATPGMLRTAALLPAAHRVSRGAAATRTFAQRLMPDIVLPPAGRHTATVIFLHGLGDTGHGWQDAMEELQPSFPHTRFILPTAPTAPVTLNGGMPMPSWFDITSLEDLQDDGKGVAGFDETVARVWGMLDAETKDHGIPASRIILGGFSQGGASALFAGFTYREALGGVMGLSSWLPLSQRFAKEATAASLAVPFLLCHGKDDQVVRFKDGEASRVALEASGRKGEFQSFRGLGHSLNMDELRAVAEWLTGRIPPTPTD